MCILLEKDKMMKKKLLSQSYYQYYFSAVLMEVMIELDKRLNNEESDVYVCALAKVIDMHIN